MYCDVCANNMSPSPSEFSVFSRIGSTSSRREVSSVKSNFCSPSGRRRLISKSSSYYVKTIHKTESSSNLQECSHIRRILPYQFLSSDHWLQNAIQLEYETIVLKKLRKWEYESKILLGSWYNSSRYKKHSLESLKQSWNNRHSSRNWEQRALGGLVYWLCSPSFGIKLEVNKRNFVSQLLKSIHHNIWLHPGFPGKFQVPSFQ